MAPPMAVAAVADDIVYENSDRAKRIAPVEIIRGDILKGIGLVIASTLFFSAGDVASKITGATIPPVEVTWFRYIVFLALAVPLSFANNGLRAFKTRRPAMHIVRAIGLCGASITFIFALRYMQPSEATAINFLSPLFITLLAVPFLGETLTLPRLLSALVGFLGVLLIVRPGSDTFQMAALYPVATAGSWAVAMIATRKITDDRPDVTMAWTAVVGFTILSVLVPIDWRTPDFRELWIGLLAGVLSLIGQALVVIAYRKAEASLLAPFAYAQLIFAGGMGYIVFGVAPGPWTLIGGVIIAASGVYSAKRETRAS